MPRPIGVYRGRECGNQQPSHVISFSLHVVHAPHAIGAYQQAAGAPVVARAAAHQDETTDADTTMFVSIGACSGGTRSCGILVVAERLPSKLKPL